MAGILAVTSFLLLYQLWQTYKSNRHYKAGGIVMSIHKQQSFLTKVVGAIVFLSVTFTIGTYNAFGSIALVNLPLIAYFILMLYNQMRKIEVLEKGLFLNGRFIEWSHIENVEVVDNSTLKLYLTGEKYKIYVVEKIDNIATLQKIVQQEVKKISKFKR